jgi:hypothetical protein
MATSLREYLFAQAEYENDEYGFKIRGFEIYNFESAGLNPDCV